jgi:hypothetical protein
LNEQVEAGLDPRLTQRQAKERAEMTVAKAHALYMHAVREGSSSRRRNSSYTLNIIDNPVIHSTFGVSDQAPENPFLPQGWKPCSES